MCVFESVILLWRMEVEDCNFVMKRNITKELYNKTNTTSFFTDYTTIALLYFTFGWTITSFYLWRQNFQRRIFIAAGELWNLLTILLQFSMIYSERIDNWNYSCGYSFKWLYGDINFETGNKTLRVTLRFRIRYAMWF